MNERTSWGLKGAPSLAIIVKLWSSMDMTIGQRVNPGDTTRNRYLVHGCSCISSQIFLPVKEGELKWFYQRLHFLLSNPRPDAWFNREDSCWCCGLFVTKRLEPAFAIDQQAVCLVLACVPMVQYECLPCWLVKKCSLYIVVNTSMDNSQCERILVQRWCALSCPHRKGHHGGQRHGAVLRHSCQRHHHHVGRRCVNAKSVYLASESFGCHSYSSLFIFKTNKQSLSKDL